MKGSQIIIECLRQEGVEVAFGYPGGCVIPLFDSFYDEKQVKVYLVRHEQAAAHAADGYARATGNVGVCIATSGPGATNLVTGIATAYMDSIPMVCITGQVNAALIGNDAFQEADVTGITRSISKHNFLVKDIKDLAHTIKEAFFIARTGRPGPVVVDVPVNIQKAEYDFDYSRPVVMRSYKPTTEGHPGQIKRAMRLLKDAKKPLLMIGGGIITAGAEDEIRAFVEQAKVPVTATFMALGSYRGDAKYYLAMPGMHGTVYANKAITDCDVLLAVGCRFDDRVTGKVSGFAPHAKIIHVDIDPTSISKNVRCDIPIVGDAKHVLKDMLAHLEGHEPETDDWMAQITAWKTDHPLVYKQGERIKPQEVIATIDRLTNRDAIICTEVGQHQMWSAQFFEFQKSRHWISSGGLGTMGFGFPAAVGAALGRPDKTVFDIAGDGSIQMNIQELGTVADYKIPVKIVIMNNHFLGMVRQWQEMFHNKRYSMTPMKNPDFVMLAASYGIKGRKVTKHDELEDAVKECIAHDGAYVLDVQVETNENVYPMVPAGETIDRMLCGLA
jgi:acetolactate synthase-1/2/3 large subunit